MSTPLTGPESGGPPPLPQIAPGPYVRLPKNPILATFLSGFPGLGQVYNGQPSKAVVFFSAWVFAIYGTAEINPMPFAFLIPFVYLYNLVDAYKSATLINNRFLGGGAAAAPEDDTVESPAWGGTLIGLGVLLLLHNTGFINLASIERYWPVLLIGAGVVLVYGSVRKRKAAAAEAIGGPLL
jgi:TM2 domain-containing membrane protein YozV